MNSLPVFNQNSYYCSCKSGYFGKNCSLYEPYCITYCPAKALCRSDDSNLRSNNRKIYCICPSGHFGPGCNLKYDECNFNSCLNNGTCSPSYHPNGETVYVCKCPELFHGNRCQHQKESVRINFNITNAFVPLATVIQLFHYNFEQ